MSLSSKVIYHCKENHLLIASILHKKDPKNEMCIKSDTHILIVFTPFIGDTILYLNVLRKLVEFYHAKGKKCNIVTLKQNKVFIEQYCQYDKVITFDFKQYVTNKTYREQMNNELFSQPYEKVINPYFDNLIDADMIAITANAKEKLAADRYKVYSGRVLKKSLLKNSLRKHAYTKKINTNVKCMDFIKQSYFMKALGIDDFSAKISYMERTTQDISVSKIPFCVIAPGASKAGKRWEPEKFASIIKTLVHNYGMNIFICGSKSEESIYKLIIDKLDDQTAKKVINNMGKTTLLEYLELIRNAELVISNDSSPVHMAASVGTPCVCIIGGWDYHRLLPYEVEKQENDTRLPIPIYSEVMSCFNCFDHSVGYKNKQCKNCVKMGLPYPCITKISVSEVEKVVKSILSK